MSTKCTLTPIRGGSAFELPNITNVSWGADRPANAAGTLARDGHDIGTVSITRAKAVEDEAGKAKPENEAVDLFAQRGDRAYAEGEITCAQAGNPNNVLQTIRWERGNICSINNSIAVGEDGAISITEQIEIAVTGLTVNDAKIQRVHAS